MPSNVKRKGYMCVFKSSRRNLENGNKSEEEGYTYNFLRPTLVTCEDRSATVAMTENFEQDPGIKLYVKLPIPTARNASSDF